MFFVENVKLQLERHVLRKKQSHWSGRQPNRPSGWTWVRSGALVHIVGWFDDRGHGPLAAGQTLVGTVRMDLVPFELSLFLVGG